MRANHVLALVILAVGIWLGLNVGPWYLGYVSNMVGTDWEGYFWSYYALQIGCMLSILTLVASIVGAAYVANK